MPDNGKADIVLYRHIHRHKLPVESDHAGTICARSANSQNSQDIVYMNHGHNCELRTRHGVAPTITAHIGTGGNNMPFRFDGDILRYFTPMECERLMGIPDNHTRIKWKRKPELDCPKGHRYKAIGNAMPVPVVRWIGEQISRWEHAHKA